MNAVTKAMVMVKKCEEKECEERGATNEGGAGHGGVRIPQGLQSNGGKFGFSVNPCLDENP